MYFNQQAWLDLLAIQGIDNHTLSQRLNLPERISTEEYLAHGSVLAFNYTQSSYTLVGCISHLICCGFGNWVVESSCRVVLYTCSAWFSLLVLRLTFTRLQVPPLATFGGYVGRHIRFAGVLRGVYADLTTTRAPFTERDLSFHAGKSTDRLSGVYLIFLAQMANTAHLSGFDFWLCDWCAQRHIIALGKSLAAFHGRCATKKYGGLKN